MIRNLGEESLRIKTKHWLPSRKGGQAIMEQLIECGIQSEEWEKHNLCRMSLGFIYVSDVYTLQGRLKNRDDEEWEQSKTTLTWPRASVPRKFLTEWYEILQGCLPDRRTELVWTYRKSLAGINEDGTKVRYCGQWYERTKERTRN